MSLDQWRVINKLKQKKKKKPSDYQIRYFESLYLSQKDCVSLRLR